MVKCMMVKFCADISSIEKYVSSFIVITFSSYLLKDNGYFLATVLIGLCWVLFELLHEDALKLSGRLYNLLLLRGCVIAFMYIMSFYDKLFLIPANIMFAKLLQDKGAAGFPVAACCAVPVMFILELLGYWGMPFSSYLIWFWGIPFLVVSSTLFCIKKRYPIYLTSMALVVSIILNQFALYACDNGLTGVKNEANQFGLIGVNQTAIKNVWPDSELVESDYIKNVVLTGGANGKWVVMSPSTPTITDNFIRNNVKHGEYYLFAEHDIKTNFGVPIDGVEDRSYTRKGPWNVYRPHMTRILSAASDRDVLYCSNVGTTINVNLHTYPLVWEYNAFGIPVILSAGEFHGGWRLTYSGDSDPLVDFLAPYNLNFLRAFFGTFNFIEIIKAFILALYIYAFHKYKNKKLWVLFMPIFLLVANQVPNQMNVNNDIAVFGDKAWISPHIETSFSNLPKALVQQGLDIVVEPRSGMQKVGLYSSGRSYFFNKYLLKRETMLNIVFLLPGDEVKFKATKVISMDTPMPPCTVFIDNTELKIIDPRNLVANGVTVGPALKIDEKTYVIGTNSPQRIKGIEGLIK